MSLTSSGNAEGYTPWTPTAASPIMTLMLKRTLAIASLGLVTFTMSESVFWGGMSAAYADLGVLVALLAYTIVVIASLYALERLRPTGWQGVFLTGALVGWVIEGTVVNTVYLELPVSISWTGLAWHALLSVLGAWVLLPRMLESRWRWAGAVGLGLAWGGWSSAMQLDRGGLEAPTTFALYVVVATTLLGLGLRGWLRHRSDHVVPRWLGRTAVILALATYAFQLSMTPLALVLVPLVGGALWLMHRRSEPDSAPVHLTGPSAPPLAPLAVMAATAVLVQATLGAAIAPVAAAIVYFGTIVAGFALLAGCMRRIRRGESRTTEPLPVGHA